ncbi:MAG: hypothetical protein K8R48_05255 [Alphaproteobacteria bacterium]|nr:hypothetical protein [Alphaproteobacteria bacterium]
MVSRDFNNINEIHKTQALLSNESDPARIADALSGRNAPWNQNVKTALLVAQAAERAYQLARSAEEYARKHEGSVEYYTHLNEDRRAWMREFPGEKAAEYDSDIFKSVGAENDPELLKAAQATWMAAQLYLNNETRSIKEEITLNGFLGRAMTMGPEYADGFKSAAAGLYEQAAQMLSKEGHADAAASLSAVGKAIMKYVVDNQDAPPPAKFLKSLLHQEQWGLQQANIALGDEKWSLSNDYEATLQKLIKLTEPPPAAGKKAMLKL